MEELALKFLLNNMAVQTDVFGMLVECAIVSDLASRLTITIEDGLIYGLDTQIMKEVARLLKLVGGSS